MPSPSESEVQVYRVAWGWKIFLTLAAPPMVGLFGWVMLLPFTQDRPAQLWAGLFLMLIGAGMIALFVYGLLAAYKSRIEIHPERIREVGLFRTRDLPLSAIRGFRIVPTQNVSSLQLCPHDPQSKVLKLTLMFERKEELLAWAGEHFPNLDERDAEAELNEVLEDRQLGETREEREAVLDRVRLWTWIVKGAAFVALIWALLKPEPYRLVIGTLLVLPWVALLLKRCYPKIITFNSSKQYSPLPDVTLGFLIPSFMLALRALLDFDIVAWENFWLPFAAVSLVLFAAVVLLVPEVRAKIVVLLFLAIFTGCYGCGATITLNGLLDRSLRQTYYASVLEKRISHGEHKSYYVKLSPWGPRETEKEVNVGRAAYERHQIGDRVPVVLRQGRFAIPWFYLGD
jgi:hypothetical protein